MALGSYNPDDPRAVLSTKGLNTVLFTDPYAKLCYMAELALPSSSSSPSSEKRMMAAYIDLDTMFSAYFKAGLINGGKEDDAAVDIYLPTEGRFLSMFNRILAGIQRQQQQQYSLVIVDSINSFYTMYYGLYSSSDGRRERAAGGSLNHLLSVLLMLLVRRASSEDVPVVATSMLRYRKEGGWKQSPASRRLLQQKSATRSKVDLVGNELVLRILAHENIPEGTVLSYPVRALARQAGNQGIAQ